MMRPRILNNMDNAPRDRRILVYTENNVHAVNWVWHPAGHTAWLIAETDDGTQLVVNNDLAIGWVELPGHPQKIRCLCDAEMVLA